eukprot:9310298-Pyramimonas_sp.AAC.1
MPAQWAPAVDCFCASEFAKTANDNVCKALGSASQAWACDQVCSAVGSPVTVLNRGSVHLDLPIVGSAGLK